MPANPEPFSPLGTLIPVDGRRVHVHCLGRGEPVVILVSGEAGWSLEWLPVQEQLAVSAQVCAYDRPGLGWSEATPAPRDAGTLAAELGEMLTALDLPGPYVLVGAGLGGHIVRLFASRRPEEVAGVVLLDARHEEQLERLPPAWAKLEHAERGTSRYLAFAGRVGLLGVLGRMVGERALPPQLQYLPDDLRETYLNVGYGATYFKTVLEELEAVRRSDAAVRAAGDLGDLPLVVVRHERPDLFESLDAGDAGRAEATWQALQAELAGLSTRGRVWVAAGSGHLIHLEEPGIVTRAIRHVRTAAVEEGVTGAVSE